MLLAKPGHRLKAKGYMATKESLHRLVDDLPDSEVDAAERYLKYFVVARQDPFLRALANAPLDDEPETDGERAAVAEARLAPARGEVVSDEGVRPELGL